MSVMKQFVDSTQIEPDKSRLGIEGRDLAIDKYTPFDNDCLDIEENAKTLTKFIETANE